MRDPIVWRARERIAKNARQRVVDCVARGKMPRANTLKCADCGAPAVHYDQRDYRKPLEVEPVCRGCHSARGPGLPLDGLLQVENLK
jgi:hypothetical protein